MIPRREATRHDASTGVGGRLPQAQKERDLRKAEDRLDALARLEEARLRDSPEVRAAAQARKRSVISPAGVEGRCPLDARRGETQTVRLS